MRVRYFIIIIIILFIYFLIWKLLLDAISAYERNKNTRLKDRAWFLSLCRFRPSRFDTNAIISLFNSALLLALKLLKFNSFLHVQIP